MKSRILVFILIAFVVNANSQVYILPFKSKGLWGLMDSEGRVVLKPERKERLSVPNSDGTLIMEDDSIVIDLNKYGLLDTSGKVLVPAQYYTFNKWHSLYYRARKINADYSIYESIDIFNIDGKRIFPMSFSEISHLDTNGFTPFFVGLSNDTLNLFKVNWMDASYELLWSHDKVDWFRMKVESDDYRQDSCLSLEFVSERHLAKLKVFRNSQWSLTVDTAIYQYPMPEVESGGDDLMDPIIYKDWRWNWNFVKGDNLGKYRIEDKERGIYSADRYDQILVSKFGYKVRKGKKWGMLDFNAKPLLDLKFDELKEPVFDWDNPNVSFIDYRMSDNDSQDDPMKKKITLMVRKENKWGLYLLSSGIILPVEYDSIYSVNYKYFLVKRKRKWYVFNSYVPEKPMYTMDAVNWKNGKAVCLQEDKVLFVSGFRKGKSVLFGPIPVLDTLVLDSVAKCSKYQMNLYKNGRVGAVYLKQDYFFVIPFLSSDFKLEHHVRILGDKVVPKAYCYVWLESLDGSFAGFVRNDGRCFFYR